jgi:hypothetical protein
MEKESSGQGPVEVNSTGGQGSCRAVVPSGGGGGGGDDEFYIMSTLFLPTP